MRRYQQLELLAPIADPQDRWLYAMWARYQDRTDKLMYIEAGSETEARAIATKQLNRQGKPYRGITCSLGKAVVSRWVGLVVQNTPEILVYQVFSPRLQCGQSKIYFIEKII